MAESLFVGGGGDSYATPQQLLLKYGNRHGLIAGATGTGKSVTLQILAEAFSSEGVPVFLTDIKGDMSGIAAAGSSDSKLHQAFSDRATMIGYADFTYRAFPTIFWDLFGEQGHPIRATVAEMGPLLLARMLELTDAQEGVLNIAFRIADEEGLPLLDLKDLQQLLLWVGEHASEISLRYGNVAPATIGSIQRQLLVLENQGALNLFGEPALELNDLMRTTTDGRGVVSVLASDKLMQSPRLYATFLLWLLSELFEDLPEVGDPDKPKLVFFFDEAHLLFRDAPKALLAKVEQVARLIRSKGVGVFFITQNPDDVPDLILGQLGNRIQHALRAYTDRDLEALRKASATYRPNPRFNTADAIRDVGTGEAVTSFLEAKGAPAIVERTLIRPPVSQLGPLSPEQRKSVMLASPVSGKYETALDRESAYEILVARADKASKEAAAADEEAARKKELEDSMKGRRYERTWDVDQPSGRPAKEKPGIFSEVTTVIVKELKGTTGKRIVRGILGGLFKSR